MATRYSRFATQHFSNDESGVMSVVESIAGNFTLQRYDVENGRGQVRIVLDESNSSKTAAIISRLRVPPPIVSWKLNGETTW